MTSRPTTVSDYTLIVPTYNRPDHFARLLQSLHRQNASFPILVLDSSGSEGKAANRETIRASSLCVSHLEFDSSLAPFDKFFLGVREVSTRFCSLCADDDVLVVSSLPQIVATLVADDSISMAHGWYFTFYLTDHVGLTSFVYKGDSIVGSPLDRVRTLLARYEALTYGVYRTDVMLRVLELVRSLPSVLFREIGAGVFTSVRGSAVRLPIPYYGRSLGPSQNYSDWHPVEFLIGSPSSLFLEYERYQAILLNEIQLASVNDMDDAELRRLLDLFHLRYLSEFLAPRVVDHVVDGILAGQNRHDILKGVWPLLDPSRSGLWDVLRGHPLLRKIRDRLRSIKRLSLPLYDGRPGKDKVIRTTTAAGKERDCRLYRSYLSDVSRLPEDMHLRVVETMGAYE